MPLEMFPVGVVERCIALGRDHRVVVNNKVVAVASEFHYVIGDGKSTGDADQWTNLDRKSR